MTVISDNRRYHDLYDNRKYLAIREAVEQQVDDHQSYVIMNLLIDVCIDTSRGIITDKREALVRACFGLSLASVRQMSAYITTFETGGSRSVGGDIYLMTQVYQRLQEAQGNLHEVAAISGSIHSERANVLHHLLRASADLIDAGLAVQRSHHNDYVGEKINSSISQLVYALQAGLKASNHDPAYDFSETQFPSVANYQR